MSTGQAPVRVYFDASRMIARGNATPTGIDRVDMAYVRFLKSAEGFDLRLIRFDVFGPRLLHRHEADDLIDQTIARWRLDQTTSPDSEGWRALKAWLESEHLVASPRVQLAGQLTDDRFGAEGGWRRMVLRRRAARGDRIRGAVPDHPRLYLNTSHGRLFRASVGRWLKTTGMPAVFFVHDLIPIEYPQFNRPREPLRHRARMDTISRHAHHVLVNSEVTASGLRTFLSEARRRTPPITVAPLGIERAFERSEARPFKPGRPYFVVLGTIEPRKNHALLLEVWRKWVREAPESAARLVIVGRRGWLNESVFKALDSRELSSHVVECGGLTDRQIEQLLGGASALLCPSFAEGFSLPVVEALASGTPVIASDIPAHREVHQGCAELLPATDASSWLDKILLHLRAQPPISRERCARIESFNAVGWDEHFAHVASRLHAVARHD